MSCKKGGKTKKHLLLAKLATDDIGSCSFCNRNIDDETIYGKLYSIGDIYCHYFCVLLSCCLIQKGKDNEGLFGFLYPDIVAEIERSKKHKCSYCGKEGATLGCSVTQCRKQFHLPCGREKDAVSLYYGNYKSFCQLHAPRQKINLEIMNKVKERISAQRKSKVSKDKEMSDLNDTQMNIVCVICYEPVESSPSINTFWPPCCARDAWFHRNCLQRMALSAGMHYLKCPLCNDKEIFLDAVMTQGYYVPDRDAAWELEHNAYSEMYEINLSCCALDCKCPMGREHDSDNENGDLLENVLDDLKKDKIKSNECINEWNSPKKYRNKEDEKQDDIKDVNTSRMELNLKPPIRLNFTLIQPNILNDVDNILISPLKLLEKCLHERIKENEFLELDSMKLIKIMSEKFKKPKPLIVKKKIINDLLENVLDDLKKDKIKSNECINEWNSPKKCVEIKDDNIQKEVPSQSFNENPTLNMNNSQIIEEQDIKDNTEDIFTTPKKLKPVHIQKDSTMEISENDQTVKIEKKENTEDEEIETIHIKIRTGEIATEYRKTKKNPTKKKEK
ncbi:G2/M phase-specific E3 ubiquitin-protein ligase [Papilio xuthus]|uniref:G2/M phase-specific E3 ubiquitin-protein ligase n=1 Tax=Papilio xuthus TaxID=66420 RepID=A0A194Q4Q5_PAPXU|nr:G2/M phase-specific E3 ubiquitin-protein ligase [Papilio xuthus]